MAKKRKKPLSIRREQVNPWVWAQIEAQNRGNLQPAALADDAKRAVAVGFPEADRPAALAALGRYCGPETARVHRAVLVLSGGDLAELEAMVDEANRDFRNVLYWSESPNALNGTQEQKQEYARRIAAQWRKMGLQVPFPGY